MLSRLGGFALFCVLPCLVVVTRSDESLNLSYVVNAFLPDGEEEVWLRLGNTLVRDTLITHDTPSGTRQGLMLRQVAQGTNFLQLIYKLNHEELKERKHRKLAECEVLEDENAVAHFQKQFQSQLKRSGLKLTDDAPPLGSSSSFYIPPDEDSEDLADLSEADLNQELETFHNVSVKFLRPQEITADMKKAIDIRTQERHCKRLHNRMRQVMESKAKHQEPSSNRKRVRREAFRVGIMPGTLWCGDGSLADKYESMGAHVGTDRCCREHDGCPYLIDAMSSKFGMFNYRMHTISHCSCDERFRSCLKQTNTGASNFVGKIFFNVVQTKCFTLKAKKECANFSWWGKCLKYEWIKQAHLRDPIPY